MSFLNLIALAIGFIAALAASWFIVSPLFSRELSERPETDSKKIALSDLLYSKERILLELEELEADFHNSKIDEDSYKRLKSELTDQAAQYLLMIDKLGQGQGDGSCSG